MYLLAVLLAVACGGGNGLPVDNVVVDSLDKGVQLRATNDFRFVGIGYNLIKGNPDGQTTGSSHGGTDPGILSTRKILNIVEGSDGNVIYSARDACKTVEEIYENTMSYQKKLSQEINVAAEASYAGYAFAASAGFASAGEQTMDSHSLIDEKNKVCFTGSQRYKLELVESKGSRLTDSFHSAVCNLPNSYSSHPSDYMNLLDTWGTHVITELDLGYREISRKKTSTEKVLEYAESKYSAALSLSGSSGLASGSISVDISGFKSENSFKSLFTSSVTTYTIGSIALPEPIELTLKWIKDFLDAKYWSKLSGLQSRNICKGFTLTDLTTIKSQMDEAFPKYPEWLKVQQAKDQKISFPLVWPKGTYGLLKPKASCGTCPTGTWEEGSRYQDTEDDHGETNVTPSTQCASDSFDSSKVTLKYCMKMSEGGSYRRNWPKGTYCIFRKGKCPYGFTNGYVHWDDEDSNNANSVTGHLPDGAYGKNTKVEYCCRDDRFTTTAIYLPTEKPFYLIMKDREGRFCQQVYGMTVEKHYVYWDDEDDDNNNSASGSYPYLYGRSRNTRMTFCYYKKS